jgi:hypothetical protein
MKTVYQLVKLVEMNGNSVLRWVFLCDCGEVTGHTKQGMAWIAQYLRHAERRSDTD